MLYIYCLVLTYWIVHTIYNVVSTHRQDPLHHWGKIMSNQNIHEIMIYYRTGIHACKKCDRIMQAKVQFKIFVLMDPWSMDFTERHTSGFYSQLN